MLNHHADLIHFRMYRGLALCGGLLALLLSAGGCSSEALEGPSAGGQPRCLSEAQDHDLPRPSEVGRSAYLGALKEFVSSFGYRELGWCEDRDKVRDTGPYIDGVGYEGTHPPVHMIYSPKAMDWLVAGRLGPMPDGALIIKEQFYSVEVDGIPRSMMPAAAYLDLSRAEIDGLLGSGKGGWATMFKDSAGSHDGWFWSEYFAGFDVDAPPDGGTFVSDFGSPCDRCHASAVTEHTFATTANIAGFEGESEVYETQEGWRTQKASAAPPDYTTSREYQAYPLAFGQWERPVGLNSAWLDQFDSMDKVDKAKVSVLPSSHLDHVPHPPTSQYFVTADQCLGCHGALPSQPVQTHGGHGTSEPQATRSIMFVANPAGMGTDISPYGDWRFTPMGLAGRDPIFYAQLETEVAMVAADGASADELVAFQKGLTSTCMSCHGGPGVRQAASDGVPFSKDFIYIDDPKDPNHKYGALARDGINCTMCHHVREEGSEAEFFANQTTGAFAMSDPGVIYGPYATKSIHQQPMENGVGFRPEYSEDLADSTISSRLCGHCHTINLPVIDSPLTPGAAASEAFPIASSDPKYPFKIHPEQATYTEWLNSDYQTVFGKGGSSARSCQACHMGKRYGGKAISTIIAAIEDNSYPSVPYLLPDLDLEERASYGRHQFVGLNVPLLMMFGQFRDVLGVAKENYMTGLSTGLANTIAKMLEQAANDTVELELTTTMDNQTVVAVVDVKNLTGHRFPSGVAFRRAWLEVLLVDKQSKQRLWGSGQTNEVGVILDATGKALPSEFFSSKQAGFENVWQPHHETIDSQDQVQIYEEIALNAKGDVTYSFLRRNEEPKDNRLLPRGWTAEGPSPSLEPVIASTHPAGAAKNDPRYLDGSGTDRVQYRIPLPAGLNPADVEVEVTMFYQATSPAFLREKFLWSKNGPATQRLYYLMSNLNTKGTPIEGWKLPLKSIKSSPE